MTTSAPSRRQTLPSSSPMTPAPITHSRLGTASSSSAPQESMICWPSKGKDFSAVGTEPLASTTWRARSGLSLPSVPVTSTTRPASSLPRPNIGVTPAALRSAATPPVMPLTIAARRFCMAARSRLSPVAPDAVGGELVLGAMPELRGFQQRLGGNAAGIQAGAAECAAAVAIAPGVDAGHLEPVLRGADRRRVARGPPADDHHVVIEILAHDFQTPSSMRPGSSRPSFTATRNCTASLPSMMR